MKLLLITRNFPPLLGGMERLNQNLARELAAHGEVRVIAPSGSAAHAPTAVEVAEVGGGSVGRFLAGALSRGVSAARRFRPDVVLAGSGLTAPMAWAAARASGARAAVYLHGLDVATPHRLYRTAWHPFLRRMDSVIVNSRPTGELARRVGVPDDRIRVVPPGVALPEPISAERRSAVRAEFRKRHGLGEGPLLLSVGRLTTRKGLLEFVRDVLPMVAEQVPEVQLAIVGGVPSNALVAKAQTPKQILAAAEEARVADRLHFLGEFTEWAELQAAYLAADVHVFPVREIPGDPEGFGMVAVEAAAHGLPTVAYATGGIVDAVEEGVSGRLVHPGDLMAFAAAMVDTLGSPPSRGAMQSHAAQFSWSEFGQRLSEALRPC